MQAPLSDQGRSGGRRHASLNCRSQMADFRMKNAEGKRQRRSRGDSWDVNGVSAVIDRRYRASRESSTGRSGCGWLDGVVEPEWVMKFLTVRNLISHWASGGYRNGAMPRPVYVAQQEVTEMERSAEPLSATYARLDLGG